MSRNQKVTQVSLAGLFAVPKASTARCAHVARITHIPYETVALQAIPFSTVCVAEGKEEAKRVELNGSFKKQEKVDRIIFVVEDGTKYNIVQKQRKKASKFIGEKVDIVAKVRPGKIEGNKLIVYLGKITKASDSL